MPSSGESCSESEIMLRAAREVISHGDINALILYVDGLSDYKDLELLDYNGALRVILIARTREAVAVAQKHTNAVVRVPGVTLTRMGQIKMTVILSFSKGYLKANDRFVYLTGMTQGVIDTMMVMTVGQEYEMFQTVNQPPLTEHIRRAVFERVLTLALELASEGREGKPVGAIFVLGDSTEVLKNSRQMILNPFKGYDDSERNMMDDRMRETVKEFASIDGAFVIKGTGTIVSGGTYLLPKVFSEELPQGLGARHAAAAAITAVTRSIAVTISESTSTVRIWRGGKLITEIEKAARSGGMAMSEARQAGQPGVFEPGGSPGGGDSSDSPG